MAQAIFKPTKAYYPTAIRLSKDDSVLIKAKAIRPVLADVPPNWRNLVNMSFIDAFIFQNNSTIKSKQTALYYSQY